MNFKPAKILGLIVAIIGISMLVACGGSADTQDNEDTGEPEGASGSPAMVDSVTVEQRDNHYYAVINGFYPDPCTYISSVEQEVDGNTINITLLTASPADFMCAAVLTPYRVDVLLTIGGLLPQEYTVVVNDGPTTTFSLDR